MEGEKASPRQSGGVGRDGEGELRTKVKADRGGQREERGEMGR
jgi:hypothetical protein